MNEDHKMWHHRYESYDEFVGWREGNRTLLDEQWRGTLALQARLVNKERSSIEGYCWVCGKESSFEYDLRYSNGRDVNWRERLLCAHCGLSNRLRLTPQVLASMEVGMRGYVSEQVTPLAKLLSERYPGLIKSEFLNPDLPSGQVNWRGIRHENLTCLSMPDASFDFAVSCDVLEHIPDYHAALREISRVLVPGGKALLTAPFVLTSPTNIVRAHVDSGRIVHLMEPEYHGDPVSGNGVLCFYHFGWELLNDLKSAGFREAYVELYWSAFYANIGSPQVFIIATR